MCVACISDNYFKYKKFMSPCNCALHGKSWEVNSLWMFRVESQAVRTWMSLLVWGYKYQADTMTSFYEVDEFKVIEAGFDNRAEAWCCWDLDSKSWEKLQLHGHQSTFSWGMDQNKHFTVVTDSWYMYSVFHLYTNLRHSLNKLRCSCFVSWT